MAAYSLGMNEEREPYLSLELRFPALASSRRMVFMIDKSRELVLKMSEKPSYEFVARLVHTLPSDGNVVLDMLAKSKGSVDLALKYAKRGFAPKLILTPQTSLHENTKKSK